MGKAWIDPAPADFADTVTTWERTPRPVRSTLVHVRFATPGGGWQTRPAYRAGTARDGLVMVHLLQPHGRRAIAVHERSLQDNPGHEGPAL